MDSSSIAVDEYFSQLQAPTSLDKTVQCSTDPSNYVQCSTETQDPNDCVQCSTETYPSDYMQCLTDSSNDVQCSTETQDPNDYVQCSTETYPSDCVQSMQSLKLSSEAEGKASFEGEKDTIVGDGWTVVSKGKQKQR